MANRPPYVWSLRAGRYRDPKTGRFVSLKQVREAIDKALERAELEGRQLALRYRDGTISLIAWELGMRQLAKDVTLYSAAAAKGGWAQLSPNDLNNIGSHLKDQFEFLREFGKQLSTGKQALDGRFLQRADMYIRDGRALYHMIELEEHAVRGFKQYRNVLHSNDRCDGCIRETGRGFVPLGELVPIGSRDCRGNDKCSYQYEGALA